MIVRWNIVHHRFFWTASLLSSSPFLFFSFLSFPLHPSFPFVSSLILFTLSFLCYSFFPLLNSHLLPFLPFLSWLCNLITYPVCRDLFCPPSRTSVEPWVGSALPTSHRWRYTYGKAYWHRRRGNRQKQLQPAYPYLENKRRRKIGGWRKILGWNIVMGSKEWLGSMREEKRESNGWQKYKISCNNKWKDTDE